MTTVILPDRALERLARSAELPLALGAADPAVADGAPVRLQSRAGHVVGTAVLDRGAGCWRLLRRGVDGDGALDSAWTAGRLQTAWTHREAHGLTVPDTSFRLVNGAGDGLPGILADVYGAWVVISALSEAMLDVARTMAESAPATLGLRGALVKRRVRGQAAGGPAVVLAVGEPPPDRLVVGEGPWRFEVHLATGVNVGLFTDMRDERARLAALARGRRVLNLFAYTGTLSVAAAWGGAAQVTSVDRSDGVLAWARDHFALNALATPHETVADDAGRFLVAAAARGDRFDLILCDPPSYSAARDAPFAVDRDYAALIAAACRVLAPDGLLWLASNTRGFGLTGAAHAGVSAAGRRASVVAEGGLPADYPTELADIEARYLQAILLRVGI